MNVACWASRRRALAERARRTRVARMTGSDAEVIVAMKRERYRVSGENAAISERRAATSDLESPSTDFALAGPRRVTSNAPAGKAVPFTTTSTVCFPGCGFLVV